MMSAGMIQVAARALGPLAAVSLLVIGILAGFLEASLAQGRDPVAEAAFREYKTWKQVSTAPIMSEAHNDTWVVTWVNAKAEAGATAGRFPLPEGAIVVKESFQNANQKPGARGPVYVMEKRARGYDPAGGDWHWAVVEADGKVSMSGTGRREHETFLCADCHAKAKVNDYLFGRGTTLKVTPVTP